MGLVLPDCMLIHGGSPAVSPTEQEADKPSGTFRGDLPEVQDAISVSQEPVVPNRKKAGLCYACLSWLCWLSDRKLPQRFLDARRTVQSPATKRPGLTVAWGSKRCL